ncbi:MAG TPA: hypothetical protein VFU43_18005 [Streptosporangiaceae bacterium]|nr:hypothetical protein [Streptosporangiaceae bacterium]
MSGYGRSGRDGRGVLPVVLAGGLAAAVIVITVAAVVLSRNRSGDDSLVPDASERTAAVQNSPMSLPAERGTVPDACTVVRAALANTLVPRADRTNMRSPDTTDTHTDCAWSAIGGARSRQLTVELRAVQPAGGRSATTVAKQTFQGERRADESGKGLLSTQRVVARKVIVDLGDEAYVTYNIDSSQGLGEAIVNVRVVNVLVTVRYAGGDVSRGDKGRPLPRAHTMAAATTVARQAVTTLAATQ